ncbi:MAG: hypothetical protein KJ915_00600, partial [Candidatus Omnitrophica bacterium]|nr:hypothetical protein [Candidatus Omnitrophota bacterium]
TTSATTNLATTLPGDLTKPAVDKTPIPITTSATTNLATTLPGDLTKPALDKTPIPITTSATTNLATTSPGDLTKPVPETGKPIIGVNKPVPVTGKPVIGVNKPVPETGKPELASPAETYQAVISTIDDINTRVANGEAVSDDEISAAINKMADFLQSNGCNELTDGQQNHLLNKFANFTNNQLFNSDNNKMGTENVLQTLVDTYQARLDGAGNNTTRANVIIRLHGSISKLGACNNTEAKTALLGALTDWTGKNDAKIESMVSDINNFVSNPTADGNNTVGLKAGAVLALVYHNKDTVGADDIMAACASLMKSDSFKDVSHQGTVHWFAAGVINRNIVNDSASAAKVADVATGKTYAGSNASLQLVDAYFSSVKETMVAGGIEGAENAPAFNNFHAAFQSMSCVLNQISGRIGSTGSAERVSEHMFEGVSAETMQSYISEASARIDNSATPANAKVSYANGMVNLLTYGSMGNAKIDVSVGSANFNTVMTSVKGLIADKGTMLKVRDLRTVNNFINAVTELSNLVMMDTSLTTSQKEAYAADFGDLLKGALSFHEGESSVNPSSYVAVNANAKVVVNGLTDNLNSRGYNNLSDILQDKLKGVFQG